MEAADGGGVDAGKAPGLGRPARRPGEVLTPSAVSDALAGSAAGACPGRGSPRRRAPAFGPADTEAASLGEEPRPAAAEPTEELSAEAGVGLGCPLADAAGTCSPGRLGSPRRLDPLAGVGLTDRSAPAFGCSVGAGAKAPASVTPDPAVVPLPEASGSVDDAEAGLESAVSVSAATD